MTRSYRANQLHLRSHAHGQGYTDLNVIILETIEGVDVHKGAYLPEYGDFVTAGAVNFRTRDLVKEGVVQGACEEFSTQRYLLMVSPTTERTRTLVAAEGFYTNGPYLNDNQCHRVNLMGKATTTLTGRDELRLMTTFLQARWDGSGELPLRAVQPVCSIASGPSIPLRGAIRSERRAISTITMTRRRAGGCFSTCTDNTID